MQFQKTKLALVLLSSTLIATESFAQKGELEEIVVKGKHLSVDKLNSIKTPTPIIDVPQSLSIVTAEHIKARGIDSVGDIIDYAPGVNTSQGEGHRDAVVFRGVRSTADFFIDGSRDDVQYFRGLFNVEQVEILRGPNALLFGRGGTGGIFNRATKKAQVGQQFTSFKASGNTFGGATVEIDSNFSTSDTSSFRINAHFDELNNHRDFYDGERVGFNPTARFELSSKTTLDLSYEYANHERFIDRGIPTGPDGLPVSALVDITFTDPERSETALDANLFRAALQHDFTSNLKGNFSAFYGDYDKVYQNFFPVGFDAQENTVDIDGYIDETDRQNLILSANLVSEFTTGNIGHTVVFGGEYIDTSSDQFRFNSLFASNGDDVETFSVADTINFNNGIATLADGTQTTNTFSDLNDDTESDIQVTSFYVQDQIAISDQLDIVLGLRYDRFDIDVLDNEVNEPLSNLDEEVSPRAGIIYKPKENISLYASYSESFLPRSGEQFADISGSNDLLDPNSFQNSEIGIKWDANSNLSITAALFKNEQTTPEISGDDPSGTTLIVLESDISGFELQVNAQITDHWSVAANYSFLEGEIASQNDSLNGITPRELPENTFSIWNMFQVNSRIGLGLGATFQDESFTSNSTSGNGSAPRALLPSYTRLDASAYYDLSDKLRLQVNIENLTDTEYFPNAHTDNNVTVGAPINALFSVNGKF